MGDSDIFKEAERQFTICNSCRYCEGYCAVWPAMELRRFFGYGDLLYLANLCHDCRDCYYACPYTAPHEFAIDIPRILMELRRYTYSRYSWPFRGSIVSRPLVLIGLALAVSLALILLYLPQYMGAYMYGSSIGVDNYYAVPRDLLVYGGLGLGLWAIVSISVSALRFWRDIGGRYIDLLNARAWLQALRDLFTHRWFRGGGYGCDYPGEGGGFRRMAIHMASFYGFILTFIATVLAYIHEEHLGVPPPYQVTSPIVLSGLAGGLLISWGTSVALYYRFRGLVDRFFDRIDYPFLLVLNLTALTGLLLLYSRLFLPGAYGFMFAIHMGFVVSLFIAVPYSKFVHWVYRLLSLLKYRLETAD